MTTSSRAAQARIAGYAWRAMIDSDPEPAASQAAYIAWAQMVGTTPDDRLRTAWEAGVADYNPATGTQWLTPAEVASRRRVHIMSVWRIRQDDDRRQRVFPSARSTGEGRRRMWLIRADEADAWRPNRGGRRKHDGGDDGAARCGSR